MVSLVLTACTNIYTQEIAMSVQSKSQYACDPVSPTNRDHKVVKFELSGLM